MVGVDTTKNGEMPTDAAKDAQASPAAAEAPETDDLETARKAVEDTAAIGGGLWLSYLFVLFYVGIAAGAVTHADLLLQAPVKLPFLNIELPLLAFFFLAPLLLLLTHAYTLVHLVLLARRVEQFNALKGLSEAWRRRLPSNIFVQFLGAPEEDRYGPFGLLLGAILWVTLVVAPIALYLLLEIQFLPYHSRWITWTIRIALILDLGLLWWLWRTILASRARRRRARAWKTVAKMTAGALLTPVVVLFAWGVATIPGEWQENHLPAKSALAWARERLFDGDVDPFTRRRASLFSNTLVLPSFNIYEALKIDDPKKVEWKQTLIDLRGRDLNGAMFEAAILNKADFSGAQLAGRVVRRRPARGRLARRRRSSRARRSSMRSSRARRSTVRSSRARRSTLRSFRARRSTCAAPGRVARCAQLQGASLVQCAAPGRVARSVRSSRARRSIGCAASGRVARSARSSRARRSTSTGLWRAQLSNSVAKDLFAPPGSPDWSPEQLMVRLPPPPAVDGCELCGAAPVDRAGGPGRSEP